MKVNVKMKVTPEQSKLIQQIVFENDIEWPISGNNLSHIDAPYLFILEEGIEYLNMGQEKLFNKSELEEVNADLFIRTNGSCDKIQAFYTQSKAVKHILKEYKDKNKNLPIDKCNTPKPKKTIETFEKLKDNWIIYKGEDDLEVGKDYLVTEKSGEISIWKFRDYNKWLNGGVVAYRELPEPYKPIKNLKERLNEMVNELCFSPSKEHWQEKKCVYTIVYNHANKKFEPKANFGIEVFGTYFFNNTIHAQIFINNFTKDELFQILKG